MLMGNMGEIIVVESIESTFAALLVSNLTFVSVDLFRFYHLPCVVDCLTIPAISFWLTKSKSQCQDPDHDHDPDYGHDHDHDYGPKNDCEHENECNHDHKLWSTAITKNIFMIMTLVLAIGRHHGPSKTSKTPMIQNCESRAVLHSCKVFYCFLIETDILYYAF